MNGLTDEMEAALAFAMRQRNKLTLTFDDSIRPAEPLSISKIAECSM